MNIKINKAIIKLISLLIILQSLKSVNSINKIEEPNELCLSKKLIKINNSTHEIKKFQYNKLNESCNQWSSNFLQREIRRLSRSIERPIINNNNKFKKRIIDFSDLSGLSCGTCNIATGILKYYISIGKSDSEIQNNIYEICAVLNIVNQSVCKAASENIAKEIITVLRKIMHMTPIQICSFVIDQTCGLLRDESHEWQVNFPSVKKPSLKPILLPNDYAPKLKVLHLSDTHYDPLYKEGANAECDEPLCCRQKNGIPETESAAAGKWGDYRKCDSPKRLILNMLQHIAKKHPDISYIIWTGDLPPHDIWEQTQDSNLKIINDTVYQMVKFFPNIPIFPAIGNHESVPVNSFPPPELAFENNSVSWLYDEMNKYWSRWLPETTSKTVRYGAFYSVLIKPKFRLISVNTNYCHNKNWWLLINSTDPLGELQWLINELQNAELLNEKVHIIGHIPPGDADCLKVWSRNYYLIVNRYESTITAQFFGHTHHDEFEIFYDVKNLGRALGIAYIGPSVTPYINNNPAYRIYYIDGEHLGTTRMVINHETWIMNLDEANLNGNPIWYKSYNVKQEYGMKSLLPSDWDLLIDELSTNLNSFNVFYKNYYARSPVIPRCDFKCRTNLICNLRSGKSHDKRNLCLNTAIRKLLIKKTN